MKLTRLHFIRAWYRWYAQGFKNRDITLRNVILVWLIASGKYFSKRALLDSTVGVQQILSGPHLQLLSHSHALRWFIDFLSIISLLIHSLTRCEGALCANKDIASVSWHMTRQRFIILVVIQFHCLYYSCSFLPIFIRPSSPHLTPARSKFPEEGMDMLYWQW